MFRAKGCHACNQTGYRGRIGIVEIVEVDDRLRDLIVNKATAWDVKKYATEELGMQTLREDGLKKVATGLTSLEEILRVTSEE